MIRAFDIFLSAMVLLLTAPVILFVAIAIKLSSPGPVLYMAQRAGINGVPFRMYKFRSMHIDSGGSQITGTHDPRVFAVGSIIRTLKLDELPQFGNVITGDMAIVGPRPEAPEIVDEYYQPWMHETLKVRPGITSPGAIFYYAYGDELLASDDPEAAYVEALLAPKLALDLAYSKRANLWSNIVNMVHTAVAIVGKALGKPIGPQRRDLIASAKLVDDPKIAMLIAASAPRQ